MTLPLVPRAFEDCGRIPMNSGSLIRISIVTKSTIFPGMSSCREAPVPKVSRVDHRHLLYAQACEHVTKSHSWARQDLHAWTFIVGTILGNDGMSLQKVRSEIEAIETSYMSLRMQLKLVLGYLKDDVPDIELARRFLGEAKKMVSELNSIIYGLSDAFSKIDRKLGTDVTGKAGRLHEYITSTSSDPENGVIKVLDLVDETILANDVLKAAIHLEALQASLDRKGDFARLGQGINWEALKEEDLLKTVSKGMQASKGEGKMGPKKAGKRAGKRGPKKICLIYSTSPENDYLVWGLVGRFLRKNDIEPTYLAEELGEGRDRTLKEFDTIIAFITRDMARPEKRLPQVQKGDRRKLAVYVESGTDVPQEVKDRYDLQYFSRDRTGELLIQISELI